MRCGARVRGFSPDLLFGDLSSGWGCAAAQYLSSRAPRAASFGGDDRGMETRGHKRNIGCAGEMSSCKHGGCVDVRIQTYRGAASLQGAHMQIPSITPHVKAPRWFDSACVLIMSCQHPSVLKAQRPVSLYCTLEP